MADVVHALVRAASALLPTPAAPGRRSVECRLDAARGSACATAATAQSFLRCALGGGLDGWHLRGRFVTQLSGCMIYPRGRLAQGGNDLPRIGRDAVFVQVETERLAVLGDAQQTHRVD